MEQYQHFGRDDSVPVKFGPKGTDANRKDACSFHARRPVQSAIADVLIDLLPTLQLSQ